MKLMLFFACSIFSVCNSLAFAATPKSSAQPNIVFILVDDLAWADLGCYGHPWHRTPNIDRLASEGLRFTSAYSPAPICSAARASILTGKAVPRLGFEFVTKNDPGNQQLDCEVPLQTPPLTLNLPLAEQTIAETLSPLGYQTAFFGKWHVSQHYQRRYNAWHPDFGPRKQGFQVAVEDVGDHPYAWTKKQRKDPDPLGDGQWPQDTMVQKVVDFIAADHDRPFFVMASSFYVHSPVLNRCRRLVDNYEQRVPNDAQNRNKRLEYAAFLETLDHHVGGILQSIEDAGVQDDTLVVFLSDNGGHPEFTGNAPLRGSKWNLYEGGIRVPMLARWPGKITPKAICDTPVIGYDLLATFRDVAGQTASQIPADSVDGISILPAFEDPDWQPDRSLVWHFPYYHPETTFSKAITSIGFDDFQVSQTRPQSAIRKDQYKLIQFAEDDRVELYDLHQDRSEQNDLGSSLPDVAMNLQKQLSDSLQAMNARLAFPAPDSF